TISQSLSFLQCTVYLHRPKNKVLFSHKCLVHQKQNARPHQTKDRHGAHGCAVTKGNVGCGSYVKRRDVTKCCRCASSVNVCCGGVLSFKVLAGRGEPVDVVCGASL
ncbi:unnamed protein product, partial [Ixodes persulcatus]